MCNIMSSAITRAERSAGNNYIREIWDDGNDDEGGGMGQENNSKLHYLNIYLEDQPRCGGKNADQGAKPSACYCPA